MQLLVFNAGSSSLKFELLEFAAGGAVRRLAAGAFNDAAGGTGELVFRATPSRGTPAPVRSLAEAAARALAWLADPSLHGRNLLAGLAATVHRVVHGGERFRATTLLAEAELAALAELGVLAPLHNPPALAVIATVRDALGPALPVIGVFDTAYYADLPASAYQYAVPERWRSEFGVRRYGFHGLAHRSMCQAARTRLQALRPTGRIVSLQLGRGCSVTATRGERAIATSMGFTPLEGLVMGTRCGDLDPGALLYVLERTGMSAAAMRRELNEHSGLLGLSGQSADMRELLALAERGNAAAALAVEVFCRRARHCVAAYLSELDGVDVIVFGGGIGENSPAVRQRVVAQLGWAGIEVDAAANAAALGVEASIATTASRVAIEVIPVDEAGLIAREAAALLERGASSGAGDARG